MGLLAGGIHPHASGWFEGERPPKRGVPMSCARTRVRSESHEAGLYGRRKEVESR
jgi:hypothetical protein